MAKKNKTGGTASHKGPQSPLRAFALVAAISTLNLQYADLTGLESEVKNQLIAILILPLYFSKEVIIWFYFLILLIIGWVKVEKEKKNLLKAPTMFGNNSRNGNPLDGGNNQVLNRRALDLSNDHDNFSDDERDAPYFNNGLNLLKQASERRTSGNWMFANDGFEPEYAAPFGQTESGLQPHLPESNFTNPYMVSSVPGYNTVQPGTHLSSNYEQSGSQRPLTIQESLDITLRNRPRKLSDTYMSDVDSVVSEYDRDHRRLGRPVIPERDYPLPRAHSKRSSGSRSIIRTPSGKYSSASDYLRGYTPQEAPVMEEDYGKRGYYSKQ
ncbi:hypothetical protein TCAL_08299 [Tigriopus californicus]|uniref:Uncharacterized protein n=1 Tax=Tigriopus californicus TaxID=6832 RepID=A0A553NBT9_TIGCA|nr:hypothetical protein TCAL_08299 [Tigriopus californicus]